MKITISLAVFISTILALFLKPVTFGAIGLDKSSVFSGLLALTGFVFTARTFITFKLQEEVYSSKRYRTHHKKLREDGAIEEELYEPLKILDTSMGRATFGCLLGVVLIVILSLFPDISISNKKINELSLFALFHSLEKDQILGQFPVLSYLCFVRFCNMFSAVYFAYLSYEIAYTVIKFNRNIAAIISFWEKED